MQLPANLLNAPTFITSNATPNADTSHQLLAALGAGQRYRIWSLTWAARPNNTGLMDVRYIDTSLGGTLLGGMSAGVGEGFVLDFPGGLCFLPGSRGLVAVSRSNVASQTGFLDVFYSLEAY